MARKSKSVAKHQISEIASSLKAKAAIPITLKLPMPRLPIRLRIDWLRQGILAQPTKELAKAFSMRR
jgi:hypothetical protein